MRILDIYFRHFKIAYETTDLINPDIVIKGMMEKKRHDLAIMIMDYLNNELGIDSHLIHIDKKKDIHILSIQKADHVDDQCICVEMTHLDDEDLFALFQALISREHETVDEATLHIIQQYFHIFYQKTKETITDDSSVRDLFQMMQMNRIRNHRDTLKMEDIPAQVKQEVQSYLQQQDNKAQLLDHLLDDISHMVRKDQVEAFIRNFLFKHQIEKQMQNRHIDTSLSLMTGIIGHVGTGRKELAQIMARMYDALSLTDGSDIVFCDIESDFDRIESAYEHDHIFVLDLSNMEISFSHLEELFYYYHKGLHVILLIQPEQVATLDKQLLSYMRMIELDDFDADELYQIFEKICDEHKISISLSAAASIKTILAIAYKEGKSRNSNQYYVRYLFERINMERYRRKNIPFYEIIFEDVLNTLK